MQEIKIKHGLVLYINYFSIYFHPDNRTLFFFFLFIYFYHYHYSGGTQGLVYLTIILK